jgi:hypothetical protein
MSNQPAQDFIKVCPDCGTQNEVFESNCVICYRDLSDVDAFDANLLNVLPQVTPRITMTLINLDLVTRQPDGKEFVLPEANGEYVVGRDSGSYVPDINLKSWTIPYISQDPKDPAYKQRQRGVSRCHAVLFRYENKLAIYRHPDANSILPIKVNGDLVTGRDVHNVYEIYDGAILEIGDVFAPGTKDKGPGLLIRVQFS